MLQTREQAQPLPLDLRRQPLRPLSGPGDECVLADEDFRFGKVDTGYLERLLGSDPGEGKSEEKSEGKEETTEVAAIAAAVFAVLDSTSKAAGDGNGTSDTGVPALSGWKRAARGEGLM